jgi:hypothetical protein
MYRCKQRDGTRCERKGITMAAIYQTAKDFKPAFDAFMNAIDAHIEAMPIGEDRKDFVSKADAVDRAMRALRGAASIYCASKGPVAK